MQQRLLEPLSRRKSRNRSLLLLGLSGVAAAAAFWLAYRVQWNPWPAFGVVGVIAVLLHLPRALYDRLLPQPVPMDPKAWALRHFGVEEPLDRLQQDLSLYRSGKFSDKYPDTDFSNDYTLKFQQYIEDLNRARPHFIPVNGSEKQADFNGDYNPVLLPMWLRLVLLPDLCGLNVGGVRRWRFGGGGKGRVDSRKDVFDWPAPGGWFCFEPVTQSPELDRWIRAYPQIKRLVGFDVVFDYQESTGTVTCRFLPEMEPGKFRNYVPEKLFDIAGDTAEQADALPYEPLPFVQEQFPRGHLQNGWLYFGEQFLDKAAGGHWLKIEDMTHFLVMGVSGFGKSVFLNQILQGVRHNLPRYEQVVLVDLKGGVELAEYLDYGEQFTLCSEVSELMPVLERVVQVMNERLSLMRANREKKWTGKRFLLVIDEYAQIQLAPETSKEEKQAKLAMLQLLNRISTLGRAAGITIWAQLQKGTSDVMDSSFRGNLASQVCFKVPNKLTAAGMFGDTQDLLVDPVKMPRGRFILYDADKGETHYLQARVQA